MPLPSFISVWIDLETMSLGPSSIAFGAYLDMNLSPSELIRYPPSPLAPSVMSMFVPNREVGWNWMNSMSLIGTPRRKAAASAEPELMRAFVDLPYIWPLPPDANMTASAMNGSSSPVLRFQQMTPRHASPSRTRSTTTRSSYRGMFSLTERSHKVWSMYSPVLSVAKHVLG